MQFLIIYNRTTKLYSVSSSYCSQNNLSVKELKQFLTQFFGADFTNYPVKDIPIRISSISPFVVERVNK